MKHTQHEVVEFDIAVAYKPPGVGPVSITEHHSVFATDPATAVSRALVELREEVRANLRSITIK